MNISPPKEAARATTPTLNYHGIAQVEADRKRLGITPAMLEQRRLQSLSQPF